MNALFALWDRIASAVLTGWPTSWDDVHDTYGTDD